MSKSLRWLKKSKGFKHNSVLFSFTIEPIVKDVGMSVNPRRINNIGVYVGQWEDQLPNGVGRLYLDNGAYYEGNWIKGQATGRGRYIYADGSYYEG